MDYISEIASYLLTRSHRVSILGHEIYTLIAEWEKKEIPREIVQQSIDEVCYELGDAEGGIESAERLRSVVSNNFRKWLQQSGISS